MKVEIYSDVVCPWCYIGERRFARALAAFGSAEEVEVVYRPYQLDSGAPSAAIPLKEYLAARYGPQSARMVAHAGDAAAGEGVEIDWDRALAVNTLTAHRLLSLAEREHGAGTQRALAEKLFDLHFTRGGDVSGVEELTRVAVEVGMDGDAVRSYLSSDAGMEEVEEQIAVARRLGIQAVPTFVFDGEFAVQGAQPASVFLQALEEAGRSASSETTPAAPGGSCDDGACRGD